MYKSKNDKVNELISIIEEKSGVPVDNEALIQYLERFCSDDTLDACIYKVLSAKWGVDGVEWLHAHGLLSCTPTLADGSLVYGFQKYLHWFRGYYYQVSNTSDGVGSRAHSYTRLDWALKGVQSPEAAHQVLTAAMLITAFHYRKQTETLLSTVDGVRTLEAMINDDLRTHYGYTESYTLQNLLKYVKVSRSEYLDTYVDGPGTLVVQLGVKSDCSARGMLVLSRETVVVVTKEGEDYVTHELTVPEWVYAVDGGDGCHMAENLAHVMMLFVEFLLCYSGMRLGIGGVYNTIDRKGLVRANCITLAFDVQDVFKIVEDFYVE